jgi:uncharacterized protein
MGASSPKFIADCMLGKLARGLRALGFDAAYERRIEDGELIERARADGRILLTRDTRLVKRRGLPPHLLVLSAEPAAQIRQTIEVFDLEVDPGVFLSRCLLCNVATAPIPREEAKEEVPPYVHRTQSRFARCPQCRRIYWRATHVPGILDVLNGLAAASRKETP